MFVISKSVLNKQPFMSSGIKLIDLLQELIKQGAITKENKVSDILLKKKLFFEHVNVAGWFQELITKNLLAADHDIKTVMSLAAAFPSKRISVFELFSNLECQGLLTLKQEKIALRTFIYITISEQVKNYEGFLTLDKKIKLFDYLKWVQAFTPQLSPKYIQQLIQEKLDIIVLLHKINEVLVHMILYPSSIKTQKIIPDFDAKCFLSLGKYLEIFIDSDDTAVLFLVALEYIQRSCIRVTQQNNVKLFIIAHRLARLFFDECSINDAGYAKFVKEDVKHFKYQIMEFTLNLDFKLNVDSHSLAVFIQSLNLPSDFLHRTGWGSSPDASWSWQLEPLPLPVCLPSAVPQEKDWAELLCLPVMQERTATKQLAQDKIVDTALSSNILVIDEIDSKRKVKEKEEFPEPAPKKIKLNPEKQPTDILLTVNSSADIVNPGENKLALFSQSAEILLKQRVKTDLLKKQTVFVHR